ncbi:hypothetical protein [uncultured Clostridium sp.]|uniref:hypothetical protein n=1 Tax=uncultured Clostridium sp. TaxID=59620 RepID=UPI002583A991|nr:hypothetical protein [uncultured Clostridium sp.]
MNYDRADNYNSLQDLFDECKNLIDYHIVLIMKDGTSVDGIIEKVDSNGIIMLVGEDVVDIENNPTEQRQFGNAARIRRNRRFRRRGYPFNAIRGLFPFFYPYPYPYYPFYPY